MRLFNVAETSEGLLFDATVITMFSFGSSGSLKVLFKLTVWLAGYVSKVMLLTGLATTGGRLVPLANSSAPAHGAVVERFWSSISVVTYESGFATVKPMASVICKSLVPTKLGVQTAECESKPVAVVQSLNVAQSVVVNLPMFAPVYCMRL